MYVTAADLTMKQAKSQGQTRHWIIYKYVSFFSNQSLSRQWRIRGADYVRPYYSYCTLGAFLQTTRLHTSLHMTQKLSSSLLVNHIQRFGGKTLASKEHSKVGFSSPLCISCHKENSKLCIAENLLVAKVFLPSALNILNGQLSGLPLKAFYSFLYCWPF